MMTLKPKLLKITLEFEDSIQILEGDEAQKWLNEINQKIAFAYLHHGEQLADYHWKSYDLKPRTIKEEKMAETTAP